SEIINRITTPNEPDFRNPQEIAEYLMPKLRYLEKEEFIVCSLNSKNKMTHYEVLFTGTLTNTIVHPREVYYEAIKNKAASIVVVHNHPSGDPSPSMDDNKLTKVLKETGKIMGIPLLDHLIIGNGAYYSYAEADIDNW
ncbi:JAB domain-containing protein, partial [Phascolarctobacterium succinatutens]|uniref:JAB domain-containing protein n=1 Tax=Phascolarctobacterium succinatutens TaxID=626940 RepID=UPI003A928337